MRTKPKINFFFQIPVQFGRRARSSQRGGGGGKLDISESVVIIPKSSDLFPAEPRLTSHALRARWLETKSYARIIAPPPPRFTRQPQKEKMFLALLFFAGVDVF